MQGEVTCGKVGEAALGKAVHSEAMSGEAARSEATLGEPTCSEAGEAALIKIHAGIGCGFLEVMSFEVVAVLKIFMTI